MTYLHRHLCICLELSVGMLITVAEFYCMVRLQSGMEAVSSWPDLVVEASPVQVIDFRITGTHSVMIRHSLYVIVKAFIGHIPGPLGAPLCSKDPEVLGTYSIRFY